jgi:MoaA/NifB/PqqE/SkfB family radical SAM enzyme
MEPKYCAAPWRGLHINFRGDVKTCCAGDPNMLGDLNHHSMNDILQGDRLRDIRRTIQSGRLHPEYCSNCIKAERYGRSERHWHNDVNQDFDPSTAALDEHLPSIVDVRWNITCNLACNYCGPYCSSKWAAIMKFEYRSGARPYYQQVCDYLEQHREHVREVALVGGEPLLLPENERLLDVIPEDCIVTLITNMNVDFDRNDIVTKLAARSRVGWSMSFDNVGARFEYVRYHGQWSLLERNVSHVKGFMRDQQHWGGIHAVYNLYNCTRLRELREWADQQGLKIHWQTLYQPEYLDPALHGSAVKLLAADEILAYRSAFELAADEDAFFQAVQDRFQQTSDDASQLSEFQQHIDRTEHQYHRADDPRRFRDLWPELAFMMG